MDHDVLFKGKTKRNTNLGVFGVYSLNISFQIINITHYYILQKGKSGQMYWAFRVISFNHYIGVFFLYVYIFTFDQLT